MTITQEALTRAEKLASQRTKESQDGALSDVLQEALWWAEYKTDYEEPREEGAPVQIPTWVVWPDLREKLSYLRGYTMEELLDIGLEVLEEDAQEYGPDGKTLCCCAEKGYHRMSCYRPDNRTGGKAKRLELPIARITE